MMNHFEFRRRSFLPGRGVKKRDQSEEIWVKDMKDLNEPAKVLPRIVGPGSADAESASEKEFEEYVEN